MIDQGELTDDGEEEDEEESEEDIPIQENEVTPEKYNKENEGSPNSKTTLKINKGGNVWMPVNMDPKSEDYKESYKDDKSIKQLELP